MCGIGGVTVFQGTRGKQHIRMTFIKALVDSLLIENVRRGSQASGIAVFNKEEWGVHKNPLSSTTLVQSEDYTAFTERYINDDTLNIILHTRAATQGSPYQNENNHPIVTDRVVGVHNGWLYSDAQLTSTYQLNRRAEVDSEVIFNLTDVFGYGNAEKDQDPSRMYAENMRWVAEELDGSATYALVGQESRHEMWLVKKDNPATFCYVPWFNLTFFASQEGFVTKSLEYAFKVLVEYGLMREVFAKQVMKQCMIHTPDDGTIWRFDASLPDGLSQFTGNRVPDIECDAGGWSLGGYSSRYTITRSRRTGGGAVDQSAREREVMQKWVSGETLTDEEKSVLANSRLLV